MNLITKQVSIAFILLTFISCNNKRYNLVGTTTRKVDFTNGANLIVKCFDNSDCDLSCKKQLTFIAINHNDIPIEAGFELKFHFFTHDSVANKTSVLMPGDSVIIVCGCQELAKSTNDDWNMDLTIVSARKFE